MKSTLPGSSEGVVRVGCLALAALGVWIWASLTRAYLPFGSDFTQDYSAARLLREGISIYGSGVTAFARDQLGIPHIENFHPPFQAVFFYPLGLLPYQTATWIFSALSLAATAASAWLALRAVAATAPLYRLVVPISLLWYPFVEATGTMQTSPLLALCLLGGWCLIESNRPISGAALWAFAALMKLFPAYAALFLLVRRRYRALVALCLWFALGTGGSVAAIGYDDVIRYLTQVSAEDAAIWSPFPGNMSIFGVLAPLFERSRWSYPLLSSEWAARWLPPVAALVVTAIVFVHARRLIAVQRPVHAFSVVLLGMLLCSPITWPHMTVVLLLPICAIVTDKLQVDRERRPRGSFVTIILAIALLNVPVYRWIASLGEAPFSGAMLLLAKSSFAAVLLLWWELRAAAVVKPS